MLAGLPIRLRSTRIACRHGKASSCGAQTPLAVGAACGGRFVSGRPRWPLPSPEFYVARRLQVPLATPGASRVREIRACASKNFFRSPGGHLVLGKNARSWGVREKVSKIPRLTRTRASYPRARTPGTSSRACAMLTPGDARGRGPGRAHTHAHAMPCSPSHKGLNIHKSFGAKGLRQTDAGWRS